MGDYGFKGAGEFSGREDNFNCKPDKDIQFCPFSKAFANDVSRTAFVEYECHSSKRGLEPGEYGGPAEPFVCDKERYETCFFYKSEIEEIK